MKATVDTRGDSSDSSFICEAMVVVELWFSAACGYSMSVFFCLVEREPSDNDLIK